MDAGETEERGTCTRWEVGRSPPAHRNGTPERRVVVREGELSLNVGK